MSRDTTSQVDTSHTGAARPAIPGVLLVFAAGRPQLAALAASPKLELGREAVAALGIEDGKLSRKHVEIVAVASGFVVRDLASRNGTFVFGERLVGERLVPVGTVLRLGESIVVTCADIAPYRVAAIETTEEGVFGPQLQRLWDEIERVARAGEGLHLRGETGSGKELAARRYHVAGARPGPFVAINCATVPHALAERLLFGAKKGAYSGAEVDTEGYLQAADGGTLFLDEIAELSLDVQAKLLRAIESREIVPLGSTRARAIDIGLVSATHRDLREEVAAGRFREDLYYRIARPGAVVPPLRERREDVPWLLRWMLAQKDPTLKLHATFVEEVLGRPWPGNVRELAIELAAAARAARATGATVLEAEHLGESAGEVLGPTSGVAGPVDTPPDLARIARVLAEHGGKVATAARALGMHRNQLRRLIARHALG